MSLVTVLQRGPDHLDLGRAQDRTDRPRSRVTEGFETGRPVKRACGRVLFPRAGGYHQGVQVMPLTGEGLVTCAQTRKARLAELLVG